jgi:hypothetical protein
MPSTRKPFLGSWLMRTTALSAAVLVTAVPLIVAERLGSPESQALAVANESLIPDNEVAGLPTAAPVLDLLTADLHFVSVSMFTAGIEALAADLLATGLNSSDIATEIGRVLGRNIQTGVIDYTDIDPRTLISNTAIIVSQLFEGALPYMPWPDLVKLGFDEIVAPQADTRTASLSPMQGPPVEAGSPFAYLFGGNGYVPGPMASAYAPVALPVVAGSVYSAANEPSNSIY